MLFRSSSYRNSRLISIHQQNLPIWHESFLFPICILLYLSLSHNRIRSVHSQSFATFTFLNYLDISFNNISYIKRGTFLRLMKLKTLRLTTNLIKLNDYTFRELHTLTFLFLDTNHIKRIQYDTFSSLLGLIHLDVSSNNIQVLAKNVFSALELLKILNISGNNILYIDTHTFKGLKSLEIFISNRYHLCCLIPALQSCTYETCYKYRILPSAFLRLSACAIMVLTCLLNVAVVLAEENTTVSKFLHIVLALSDVLMCLYLCIVYFGDYIIGTNFIVEDIFWTKNFWCRLASALSFVSILLSSHILNLLTLSRLYAVVLVLKMNNLRISF